MRFWLIDLPALIVTVIFKAYFVWLAVMAILCFGSVILAIVCFLLGIPSPL